MNAHSAKKSHLLEDDARMPREADKAVGKSIRKAGPAAPYVTGERPSAVSIIREQNVARVPDLIDLRTERTMQSAFTFYRGTAALMAADLGRETSSGILVPSCGDAHIGNFGFFASPERSLVFDLNDFDEAGIAPWEWDLKRMITSAIIGARANGFSDKAIEKIASAGVKSYTKSLRRLIKLSPLERYFMHMNVDFAIGQIDQDVSNRLQDTLISATKSTGARAIKKTTEIGPNGERRFSQRPPTMMSVEEEVRQDLGEMYHRYVTSLPIDLQLVMNQYRAVDFVRRVVGVGSVGTRCYLLLLEGSDSDMLILQVKEAMMSVLQQYGGVPIGPELEEAVDYAGNGARIIVGQRVLQALSDPLLGFFRSTIKGKRDFYVRQFRDMKGSVDVDTLNESEFESYVVVCAHVLARAHSQAPRAAEIVGYLGKSKAVRRELLEWCLEYENRSERDYQLVAAALAVNPKALTPDHFV